MIVAHDQELSDVFLDDLFLSILHKIPEGKWIDITKNKDQVIAGIKLLIDADYYGSNLRIVFNSDYTKFRKYSDTYEKFTGYDFRWRSHNADWKSGLSDKEFYLLKESLTKKKTKYAKRR